MKFLRMALVSVIIALSGCVAVPVGPGAYYDYGYPVSGYYDYGYVGPSVGVFGTYRGYWGRYHYWRDGYWGRYHHWYGDGRWRGHWR